MTNGTEAQTAIVKPQRVMLGGGLWRSMNPAHGRSKTAHGGRGGRHLGWDSPSVYTLWGICPY